MFLSKNKNGFYYIIYEKPNGSRGCKSTKERLKNNALKKFGAFQKELETIRTQTVIPIRFHQFWFNFLRSCTRYYTDNTVKVYQCTFNSIEEYFGDPLLTELTTQAIENYLFDKIKHTSVYSARKDLSNLSCALNRAVRDGYLLVNPCKGIKRLKLPEKQPLFYSRQTQARNARFGPGER